MASVDENGPLGAAAFPSGILMSGCDNPTTPMFVDAARPPVCARSTHSPRLAVIPRRYHARSFLLPTMTPMTAETRTLLAALQATDMLLIDDLHAWQFELDEAALAQIGQGTFASDDRLLSIECMDGRTRRVWHFSSAQVQAARFDAPSDSWSLADAEGEHRLVCMTAFGGDDSDADDEPQGASNDE